MANRKKTRSSMQAPGLKNVRRKMKPGKTTALAECPYCGKTLGLTIEKRSPEVVPLYGTLKRCPKNDWGPAFTTLTNCPVCGSKLISAFD